MFREIAAFKPHVVIIDPITSLMDSGTASECKGMVTRLIDYLKAGQVTSLFTSLTQGGAALAQSESAMSSLMDAWILLQDFEGNGERNRVLYVLKARGMAHSNQIREFLISDQRHRPRGCLHRGQRRSDRLRPGGAEFLGKAALLAIQQEAAQLKREVERKRAALERQISGLRSDHETEAMELRRIAEQVGTRTFVLGTERAASGLLRQADIKVPRAPSTRTEQPPKREDRLMKTKTVKRRSATARPRPAEIWQLRHLP